MKKVYIEGKLCVGPTFSRAEMSVIKRNLSEQHGLVTLSDSLSAAGNIQRLKILYLLHTHREMCVCDLAEILEITDSAVSQHLRRLKDKKLVTARRKGQTIYYSLVDHRFIKTLVGMLTMENTKEHTLFALSERK